MRHRTLACLALASVPACANPASRATPALTSDEREVLGVVDRLFATMRSKDTAVMRTLFEPGARLVGIRPRPSGEAVVQALTWERFAAFVASDRREWIERAWNPQVRVRGALATVWAEYDFHFGAQPSHCGVDAVHLLKTPAGWRIVGMADTYETTGCPARPAPAAAR
ncbi:MAG TPA: hypothetical protein VFS59_14820 [Gemmatimonadaceae bacterium]|nr:hypothetical protein [Gemmatimonadaceae bacterium]